MGWADSLASTKAAGLTFAANFWPWLLGAFLLGAGVAGWGGFSLGKLIYQGDALRAQMRLAEFDRALAQSTAQGEAEATRRQKEALDASAARDAAINEQVAQIPGQVAAMLAPKFTALRETINAPEFDCLRLPFPSPALRLLERPGGRAAEGGGGGEASASAGGLPADSRTPIP